MVMLVLFMDITYVATLMLCDTKAIKSGRQEGLFRRRFGSEFLS